MLKRTLRKNTKQETSSNDGAEFLNQEKLVTREKSPIIYHRKKIFGQISLVCMYLLAFLLPLFFIPSSSAELGQSKIAILVLLVSISVVSLGISIIYSGVVNLMSKWVYIPMLSISLITFLSSFFSNSYRGGLIGVGLETDSWYFISLLLLLVVVIATSVNTKKRIITMLSLMWVGFAISGVYQIIRFIFSLFKIDAVNNFLSLGGLFPSSVLNTVGSWGDLGIFSGFVLLSLAITLDTMPLKKNTYKIFWPIFSVVLLFSSITSFILFGFGKTMANGGGINILFSLISIISFFALLFSLFQLVRRYKNRTDDSIKFPLASLIIVAFGIIFMIFPVTINQNVNSWIGVPNESMLNLRPDMIETGHITNKVLGSSFKNALIGYGTHGFYIARNNFRLESVNLSDLWNSDFQFGFGYIPTILVNNGVLGLLSWLSLVLILLFFGVRLLFGKKHVDHSTTYILSWVIISYVFLWFLMFVNVPNSSIIILTFIITGLLLSIMIIEGVFGGIQFDFSKGRARGVIGVLAVLFVIVLLVSTAFVWINRVRAYTYSVKSMQMVYAKDANISTVPKAIMLLNKAMLIYPSDIYSRAINNLALVQVNYDFSSNSENKSFANNEKPKLATSTMEYLNLALSSGQAAANSNPNDFRNWLQFGSTLQTIALLTGENKAADGALQTFVQSANLAPKHPLPYYTLANLYLLAGDLKTAKTSIEQAITLKSNFEEAGAIYNKILEGESKSIAPKVDLEKATTTATSTKSIIKPKAIKKPSSKKK